MQGRRLRAAQSAAHASMMLVGGATTAVPHGSIGGVHTARRDVSEVFPDMPKEVLLGSAR